MTPERRFYHEKVLPAFSEMIGAGKLVYDIGKHDQFDYKTFFPNCTVKTIDRNTSVNPDIVLDVEEYCLCCFTTTYVADAVICNGVFEQCDNPFGLMNGIEHLTKSGGYALFGVMSVGYPIQTIDNFRFTPEGLKKVLYRYGFDVEEYKEIRRGEVPSYIYAIAKRR